MTCKVGDWVRFYRDGKLVIGVVEYRHEDKTYPYGHELLTDHGAVNEKDVIERRGAALLREADSRLRALEAEREKEVCICAAIRLDDGRVIRGHRHDDCIQTALKWKQAGQEIGRIRQEQQGFVTSRNRFVDREEGARLMRDAGWMHPVAGDPFTADTLFSEDLY